MPRKILVTGANGLIGRIACATLENMEYEVIRVDVLPENEASQRFKADNDQNNGILKRSFKGKYIVADVAEKLAMDKIIKELGKDAVILHLAAALETMPPDVIQRVNEEGTRNIFELCKKYEIKHVIFASSLMVLWDTYSKIEPYCSIKNNTYTGNTKALALVTEELQEESEYGETPSVVAYKNSKIRNEKLAKKYAEECNMSVLGLRLGAINPKDVAKVDPWAYCSHDYLQRIITLAVEYITTTRPYFVTNPKPLFHLLHICNADNPNCWVSLEKTRKLLHPCAQKQGYALSSSRLSITRSLSPTTTERFEQVYAEAQHEVHRSKI
jgi:thioester reductase-like protein